MTHALDQSFASLQVPLGSLRTHVDLNAGRFLLPSSLDNRPEVESDLQAALDAGRRGDGNWLTGEAIVAEVNNPDSSHYGESAFRIFYRAAAFEAVLSQGHGLFPPCPNQDIFNLTTSVKAVRDLVYRQNGSFTFLPETLAKKGLLSQNLLGGLKFAQADRELDTLVGWEVLHGGKLSCANTEALDLFWQTAITNAWLQEPPRDSKLPRIPVMRVQPGVRQDPSPLSNAELGQNKGTGVPGFGSLYPYQFMDSYYLSSPWNMPGTSLPLYSGISPTMNPLMGNQWGWGGGMGWPAMGGMGLGMMGGFDDMIEVAVNASVGGASIAAFGGGLYASRFPTRIYSLQFAPVAETAGPEVRLEKVFYTMFPRREWDPNYKIHVDENFFRRFDQKWKMGDLWWRLKNFQLGKIYRRLKASARVAAAHGATTLEPQTEAYKSLLAVGFKPKRLLAWAAALLGLAGMSYQMVQLFSGNRGTRLKGPVT